MGDKDNEAVLDLQQASSLTLDHLLLVSKSHPLLTNFFSLECILGVVIVHFRDSSYDKAFSVLVNIEQFSIQRSTQFNPYLYCLFLRGVLYERKMSFYKAIADFTSALDLGKFSPAQVFFFSFFSFSSSFLSFFSLRLIF